MKDPAVLPSGPITSLLARWGRASWFIVGIAAVAAISYSALAAVSGLVVPLVIAVVIGMLAAPLVDMLERRKVPCGVGALLALVAIVGAASLRSTASLTKATKSVASSLLVSKVSIVRWKTSMSMEARPATGLTRASSLASI